MPLRFVDVHRDDELAQPLITELAHEYSTRYGATEERMLRWLRGHPPEEFSAPDGAMVIGLLDGLPVTGGAFRRWGTIDGDKTAELKRIWTDRRHRQRGYGRMLLAELESRAASLGYLRVYLTTGDKQPEAEALYAAAGYTRLSAPRPGDESYDIAFEKLLRPEL